MLAVRQQPELVTPKLLTWLPKGAYDADGLWSTWLVEDGKLPPILAAIGEAVCPGVAFQAVALRGYKDGNAVTPCHSDHRAAGLSFILSMGATRTFRLHRVPAWVKPTQGCGNPDLDVLQIECRAGAVVILSEAFQASWHHQVVADPGVTEERLSLVFRTRPGATPPPGEG